MIDGTTGGWRVENQARRPVDLSLVCPETLAVESYATFSPCRQYRFALWRYWKSGTQVLFVMLNPSTADEATDDPTIRRCIGFARTWGFASRAASNLFAYRTTSAC